MGLDASWQPFRCSSGGVGYLGCPLASPGCDLQCTVLKPWGDGCTLRSRRPPGGAVATRPPSRLPPSGVAAVILLSAASVGSAQAAHPNTARPIRPAPRGAVRPLPKVGPGRDLPLFWPPFAHLRSGVASPVGSPCGHSSAPCLLVPSLCSEGHQALELSAQHIQVPSLAPSELATSPSSLPSPFSLGAFSRRLWIRFRVSSL